jgi:hypothetical protein
MKRTILTIIFSTLLFISFTGSSNAFTVLKRTDISQDESISDQSQNVLVQPKNIIITRITNSNEEYDDDSKLWVQSLYYYSITRLGFLDIPYNYLVDRDGKIYEGRSGGVYTDAQTEKKVGNIVIGYLSNSDDLTPLAMQALKPLIFENSYLYGIPRKNAFVSNMFISNFENEIAKTDFKTDDSTFGKSVSSFLNGISYSNVEHLKYIGEVKSVTYSNEVKSTDKFTVDVIFTNKNDFPWFSNKDYIYLTTHKSKESTFAVNGKWDSFSKPLAVKDQVILPNADLKVSFEMQGMLIPGKYTERFNLMKLPNITFSNTSFPVNFRILKGDFKLVKIINIPALNVRECPGPNCKVLTQVAENQIYILQEKSVGWYKIKYADNKSGWVYGQYVQEL